MTIFGQCYNLLNNKMQYTMLSDLQVKRSWMVVELLGPQTWTLDDVYRQVRQRGCRHAKVPGISVWDLSEVCTRTSRRLRWRRCVITGGAGKIVCSRRVCRQDVEVVKQGAVCQYHRNPSFVFTHTFHEGFLAGDERHPFPSGLQ